MDYKKYDRYEQEIDLIQLLLTILTKWRIILISVLIGGILGGGFTGVKHIIAVMNEGKEKVEKLIEENGDEATIDSAKLNDMVLALNYYNNYMKEQEWFDNSPMAKYGYDNMYQGVVKYSIKGDDSLSIASVYTELIRSREFCDYVESQGILDFSADYLRDVLSASINNYDQSYNINTNNVSMSVINPTPVVEPVDEEGNVKVEENKSEEVAQNMPETNINKNEQENSTATISSLVTYSINLNDEMIAKRFIERLDEYFSYYFQANVGDKAYTVEKLDEFIEPLTPTVVNSSIQSHLDSKFKTSQEYEKKIKSFSNAEKYYFQINYLDGAEVDLEEKIEVDSKIRWTSYVKSALVGIVVCGFLAVVIISCIYIFDGKIKNISELKCFNVPVYGVKRSGANKGIKLDKWLINKLYSYSGLNLSSEYVAESVQMQNVESIFIYNGVDSQENGGVSNTELWKKTNNVHVSNSACSNDRDSLIKAKELKNELIVVEMYDYKNKDLLSEIQTADLQGINVVGIVCV